MPRYTRELNELAKLFGLQTSYVDVNKRRQTADPESLIAAIRALGTPISSINEVPATLEARRREIAERGIEPVHVAWEGAVPPIKLRLHRRDAGGPERGIQRPVGVEARGHEGIEARIWRARHENPSAAIDDDRLHLDVGNRGFASGAKGGVQGACGAVPPDRAPDRRRIERPVSRRICQEGETGDRCRPTRPERRIEITRPGPRPGILDEQ